MDASFKITRREIGAAYDAGRDAVVALIEDLIEQFISMLKRQEQRIGALEQELQELVTTAVSRRRGTALNASNRSAGRRAGSGPASAGGEDSRSILVRRCAKWRIPS